MTNLNKIIEDLSKLTVAEAADLSKQLEEKWGVTPMAAATPAAAGGAAKPVRDAARDAMPKHPAAQSHRSCAGLRRAIVGTRIRRRPGAPRGPVVKGAGSHTTCPASRPGATTSASLRATS